MNSASCRRSHLAIYFFLRREREGRCVVFMFSIFQPHRETTYNGRVGLFARVRSYHPPRTKTHRHQVSNGRARPEGFSPHGQKVAKSIFLSFLALRGRRWFSSLIFLWSGGTSGTPAASIFSSLRPLPSIWARADVDTRTGLSLCTHRAKAVYEAAINLSVYVRTVLKLKEAARVL